MAIPTVQSLAVEFANAFTSDVRSTSSDVFLRLDDGSPDWMTAVVRAAHGDMMPDDWKYEFVERAATRIAEGDGESEFDLDSAFPYTADRLRWLSSHLDRPAYCDEAAEEYGTTSAKVPDLIAMGMVREMEGVYWVVLRELEQLAMNGSDDAE